jgi:hypothetical protein
VPGLQRELTQLAAIIPDFHTQASADPNDRETGAAEAILDAGEVCELLLAATHESIALNLPLLLRG